MQSALDFALEKAREADATRVFSMRLRVGALSGTVPEALQFAFEALCPGTMAQGAELIIDRVPAKFWCAKCAAEFESENMLAECASCGEVSGELRAGRELEIAALEVE